MKKLKKIVACLLATLTLLSTMSSNVFAAFSDEEGQSCSSDVSGYYVGSDGNYYVYGNQIIHRMIYNSDKTFRYYEVDKGVPDVTSVVNAMEKYQMVDSSGNTRVAYCIEAGMEFIENDGFISESYEDSLYFKNLPETAGKGIFYTLLYGYSEGKSSPVNGTNIDDYRFATQVIIWEYQQQVRSDAGSRHAHTFLDNDTQTTKTIPADEFYNDLKGRPAEKCYNWILNQIKYHTVRPSFTFQYDRDAKLNPYTMKYDSSTKKYTITLTDTSNTGKDIKMKDARMTVTRNGNKYTITCPTKIAVPQSVTSYKDVTTAPQMLVWGKPGAQTVATGASDPFAFYLYLNTEPDGTLKIVKTSEDDKISGVTFTISGNGQQSRTVTTGTDGTVSVTLLPGTYTVTENAANKYVKPANQTVTITGGNTTTATFNNKLKRGTLKVTKTSEDGLVSGIQFKLSGTSLSGQKVEQYATTNAQGVATFSNVLISGSTPYSLEEVNTASKYVVPAKQTAAIEWNKVTNKSFYNELKRGSLKVTKTAEDGLVSGIKFKLSGTSLSGQKVEQYATTNAQGVATFSNILISGSTPYTLEEVNTADKYVVPAQQTVVIEWNKVANISFRNVLKKGTITITKTGEIFSSVVIENDRYKPVFEVGVYEGADYEIYAAEDIVTDEMTILKGEHVDTVTTGTGGMGTSKELYPGTYDVIEAKAPHGLLIDPTPKQVTLSYAGEGVLITAASETMYNVRQKLVISGLKSMEQDEVFGVGTGEELLDVTYGLYAAEDITAADGSVIPADGLIEIICVAGDGKIQTTADLPFGKYYLQELSTNDSYVLDFTKYPVEFAYTGEDIPTVEIVINDGEAIVNKLFYGSILGFKTDLKGNPLNGAVFGLFAPNEADLSVENALMTVTSDDEGKFIFEKIPCGTYLIAELEAPEGYVRDEDVITVTVTQDMEETEPVTIVNKPEPSPDCGVPGVPLAVYGAVAAASGAVAAGGAALKRRKKK